MGASAGDLETGWAWQVQQLRQENERLRADVQQLRLRLAQTKQENAHLRALVADLVDEGECWYDHHGYCQEHYWFATEPSCPHKRAKELLGMTSAALDGGTAE